MAILSSEVLRIIWMSISSGLEIALISILAIGVGVLNGVYVGKKVSVKFNNCKKNTAYIWLGFLIVITAFLFPTPFGYRLK